MVGGVLTEGDDDAFVVPVIFQESVLFFTRFLVVSTPEPERRVGVPR